MTKKKKKQAYESQRENVASLRRRGETVTGEVRRKLSEKNVTAK